MKAAVYERYGPPEVVQIKEVPKPVPKANEVLIKVHATTVSSGDWRLRSMNVPLGFGLLSRLVFGLFKPRQGILGTELAGVVESVGQDVRQFKVGDAVFAFNGAGMGCHAEYKCMPESGAVAIKPANLSFEQAAALSFGGTTALDFLRRGKLQAGESVLVNGASGAVGTALVQLARHQGAEVTAVCRAANAALVQSLGAQHVIDYRTQDFTQKGQRYDLIVDTAGTAPYARCKGSLKDKGRLLVVLGGLPDMLKIPWIHLSSQHRVVAGPAAERPEDLLTLAELAQSGKYTPVIDRSYPLDQIVEAHRHVDSGHKRGSVVVTVAAG